MKGRVSYLPRANRWRVEWRAERRFRTREEAEAAARSRYPPPARVGPEPVPPSLRKLMVKLADAGFGQQLIANVLMWMEVPTPTGRTAWSRATVHNVLVRERRARAARDEEARRSEFQV